MATLNWSHLYAQGRCKAIGVSWNEDELHALHELKIPAEYVREGCLDEESYQEALKRDQEYEKKNGERPLHLLNQSELRAKAVALKVDATEDAPRDVLEKLISKKLSAIPYSCFC